MSEAALPVNQSGPGLTMVYGWSSEDRRAQGIPASVQGIELNTPTGKRLPFEFCPWCGAQIASSAAAVRVASPAPAAPRAEAPAATVDSRSSRSEPETPKPSPRAAAPAPAPSAPRAKAAAEAAPPSGPATNGAAQLRAIREWLGLSQAELGTKLGLARSSVANYENGRAPLSQRLLKWIEKQEKKRAERA